MGGVCHIYQALAQLIAHKRNLQLRQPFVLRCLETEFLSLSVSCDAVSSICAAPFTNMCSTRADNNSRKSRLRCGCHFPWCALGRRVAEYIVFRHSGSPFQNFFLAPTLHWVHSFYVVKNFKPSDYLLKK
jgi:hypothetical protein